MERKKDYKGVTIASFALLTEEDIVIIGQRGFNIVYHVVVFFMSLISSIHCYFFRNTRDKRDSAILSLLANGMSELSQKCNYPSLIVPALIRCF